MIIVVDTNIVFSGILSQNGTICDLLLNSRGIFEFYAPMAIVDELNAHHQKLLSLSGLSMDEINLLIMTIIKKIELIDLESIRQLTWDKALELTKDVDEFDTPFIALSLELSSPLWTGDKRIIKGLREKGINWILDTEKIKEMRDKD